MDINALQQFIGGLSARACSPGAPVACACSLLLRLCLNAGRATENSFERVLMVLALSRATTVDDRNPGMAIWLKPAVAPPPTPAGPLKSDRYALVGAWALAFATPTRMGDHESLEAEGLLVEEELKSKWLR